MPTVQELEAQGFTRPQQTTPTGGSNNATYSGSDLASMGFTRPGDSPVPSSPQQDTIAPAQPADGGLGLGDLAKTIPNALGDVWNLIKEGTYGTAKKIVHDIPVEAANLVKEQGIGGAIKNTIKSVPSAVKDVASSMIPQSAKELLNTKALSEIPEEFQALVKEHNGSYANALLTTIKSVPESIPEAVMKYANQIDRARQAVENHPVNEFLGYLGLKAAAEGGIKPPQGSVLNKNIKEIPGAAIDAIPGSATAGKMVRRVGDVIENRRELRQQPEVVQKAVGADIPQAQAEFIHEANPAEKAEMKKMLDLQELGVKKKIMEPENRPDAKIGQQVMNMVNHLESQKRSAITEEGQHVKGLVNKPINSSRTLQDFYDKLAMRGITLSEKGDLDFSRSELTGPSAAKDRGLLKYANDQIKAGTFDSAADVHTIRQRFLHETQNKNFTEPFSDWVIDIIHNDKGTSLRSGLLRDISEQVKGSGPGYEATTTKNAKIQDALKEIGKLMGGKNAGVRDMNIKNLNAGEVANRLEGNASAKVENALQKLEETAREYGFKSNVSIRKLVAFKTILKQIVGETQHNSLAGGVEQGTKSAIPDALEIASHGVEGNKLGMLKSIGKFVKGNTKAEQVRSLRALLDTTYVPPVKTAPTKTLLESTGVKPENIARLKTFLSLGKKAAEKAGLGEDYDKIIQEFTPKSNIDPDLGF